MRQLKFLVATDHHLGYKEDDPIMGDDSFNTFKECLETANEFLVDFVLLGGDLFHEHQPSKKAYFEVSNILNDNVFGVKKHNFETRNFDDANYLNENFKVKLPIFSIHGNHDSPVGENNISTLDQLNSNNYINYFGRQQSIVTLKITPILIIKGEIKLAIYGIGHMKDERLNLAFENNLVHFDKPLNELGEIDDSFSNILVLHQNKFKGHMVGASKRNSILESTIPKWFDFVIWGHEHESIPNLEESEDGVRFL